MPRLPLLSDRPWAPITRTKHNIRLHYVWQNHRIPTKRLDLGYQFLEVNQYQNSEITIDLDKIRVASIFLWHDTKSGKRRVSTAHLSRSLATKPCYNGSVLSQHSDSLLLCLTTIPHFEPTTSLLKFSYFINTNTTTAAHSTSVSTAFLKVGRKATSRCTHKHIYIYFHIFFWWVSTKSARPPSFSDVHARWHTTIS